MLIDEYLQDLQKLTKKRPPTYEQVAEVLALGGKQAVSNRIYRKQPLKDYEIELLDDAFKNNQSTHIENLLTFDYFPDVFGSCGNGVFQFSTKKEQITIPQSSLFKKLTPGKQYFVINAYGNSMQPYIMDKDKLIVESWEGEQIIDNRPYVFAYKDEIFIKRLAKNVDQLMIIPENKDYDVRKLVGKQLADVTIIGQIVGLMRDLR